jgi:hypothetical protein
MSYRLLSTAPFVILGALSSQLVMAQGEQTGHDAIESRGQHPVANADAIACMKVNVDAPLDPFTALPSRQKDPVATIAPTKVGEDMYSSSGVARIVVEIKGLVDAKGMLAADGMSLIPVKVMVLDACGQPIKGRLVAKVLSASVRIAPRRGETGQLVDSIGKRVGVDEIEVVDGLAQFELIAPPVAADVPLTVAIGKIEAKGKIAFAPELRPLIANGLIDGVINLGKRNNSLVPTTTMNDGFEQELTRFQREFANGDVSLSGRAAFFVKGAIKGDVLLTASFDSEKLSRQRIMQDINPDKYYPVMGDSSTKGLEARSSDRLFVRLDNGRNYFLYGDFATGEGFSQQLGGTGVGALKMRNLGQYNRTMTGIRGHREDEKGFIDGFVMHDSLRQAVEEYRGNGTSGPYSISNLNAVENSEKVEVIVRDRNNTSRILSVTAMARYVDYSFEPFSGRILLKTSLPSLDESLNPVSLRITYEVDTGGPQFWVYGVTGQRKISKTLEIGGSYVRDENPSRPAGASASYPTVPGQGTMQLSELISANAGIKTSEHSQLILETARTTSMTASDDVVGNAYRFDWFGRGNWDTPWGQGLKWDSRAFGGFSEKMFNNPAASYTGGRSEAGIRTVAELSKSTRLLIDGMFTEDAIAGTSRDAEAVRIEHKLDEKWTLDAGLRHVHQTAGAVLSFSTASANLTLPGQAPVFAGSGLNPAGAGFWGTGTGLNPITGQPQSMLNGTLVPGTAQSPALDAWTIRAGATYQYNSRWSIGTEVGQDIGMNNDPYWLAINTQYREKNWRVFARAETPTGRATAGGDYKITDNVILYGRAEATNGLASSYALDSAARSQAMVAGVRQSDSKGLENFNELRVVDGINGQENQNATGIRNTFPIVPGLKGNLSLERLKILNGNGRGASAIGGGVEWTDDQWRASTRLEWRELDETPGSNNSIQSWMNTTSVARKLDSSWTALIRNYLLQTDDNSLAGFQIQNRFQIGAAYRPVGQNRFDALMRYENKYQNNQEINPREFSVANIISVNANYHPERSWWYMGRVAAKTVNENLTGVADQYQAWILSGRVLYDFTKDWDIGVSASVMGSPQGNTRQYAYGFETGYLVGKNVWVSMGYNLSGFYDKDLSGSDYTRHGVYLRLRMKFDEKSIQSWSENMKPRFEEVGK